MGNGLYASDPPTAPWIPLAMVSVLLLVVWLVSPIWLVGSLIVFSVMLLAYGGDGDE